jgi:small conductance mechanosensitive channel
METIMETMYRVVSIYGLKVFAAIVILIVGRWIAKAIRKVLERTMKKGDVDPTVISFTVNSTHIAVLVFFGIAALGQLGIQTASVIAVLGAAGLAVGLAFQGALGNFAAGFLLVVFRPFRVGDFIEGAGVAGVVEAIHIFTTQLRTSDNKTVIVPNAKLTDDNIVNWSVKGTRRVDMTFDIGYDDDISNVRELIYGVIAADDRILTDPPPAITVSELAPSSVKLAVRPWVKVKDYWNVYSDLTEKIKKTFESNGVSIPYPQRDIHIYKHNRFDSQKKP